MAHFFLRQWFLLALALVLAAGLLGAEFLRPVASSTELRHLLVFATMLAMSLPLRLAHLLNSVRQPRASLLAIASNLLVVPLLAYLATFILPSSLGAGLLITAIVPCTIASAAVLAQRGGGDPTVAVLTTLVTNGICFLYIPAALALFFGRSEQFQIDFWQSAGQLAGLVVLPIVLGQVLRLRGSLAAWADLHRKRWAILSQLGILFMVLIGAVQTGLRLSHAQGWELALGPLIMLAISVLGIHLLALIFTWRLAFILQVSRPQAIGAAFGGSQKTLMVGLQIALDMGVSVLPMIAFHVGQLLADTIIADYWQKQGRTVAKPDEG